MYTCIHVTHKSVSVCVMHCDAAAQGDTYICKFVCMYMCDTLGCACVCNFVENIVATQRAAVLQLKGYICIYIYTCMYTHIYIYTCHTQGCVYDARVCVCIYTCHTRVCVWREYIFIYICIYTYIYIGYICIYIYTCMYIYIYTCHTQGCACVYDADWRMFGNSCKAP